MEHVSSRELEIPVLPAVAHEAMALLGDERSDTKKLAQLIHRDPSLAGHLLRVASSPYYQRGAKIVSLQQALSRLGLRAVGEIVLAICVKTSAFRVRGMETEVSALFDHSCEVAFVARAIARMKRMSAEDAFVGGLLHDLGRIALFQKISAEYVAAPPEARADLLAAVDELHAVAGGAIAKTWELPPATGEAMRWHHEPENAPQAKNTVHTIALADALAHAGDGGLEAIGDHPSIAALNLYPEELERLWSERGPILDAMKGMT